MRFRLGLAISIFLLVVTPILITGLVTMETAERALQVQAAQFGLAAQVENIEIQRLRENIVYLLIIGSVVSLAGAGIFASELAGSVNVIKRGLDALSRDVNVTIRPLRGVLGEIAASINQMAEALRETRNHRDALLQSSPNGIITVDRDGKVILFNPAVAELTGIEQQQALGVDFRQLNLPRPLVGLLKNTLGGEPTVLAKEEILTHQDGHAISAAISTSRLRNYRGDLVGALAVITDLREKRLLEAQVLRANRLAGIGALAAGVAHEIRNPLTAVKGYSQMLEEELEPTDPRREYTGIIVKEVNRLDRILRGLLAFARPAESRFQPENIQAIIEETLVLVDNAAFRRRITLQKDYGQDLWAVVDREQLKQVMLNLLLNASQAIEGHGVIRIVTRQEGERVRISVMDNGVGIPQEHLDKLFDPFFTTRAGGTGLGLAIVHQLVELHHGEVQVYSVVGQGTEFKVILPVRQGGVTVG